MRFSRLRLTGFKSFVDPTDLLISEGMTGVVGPNGCGKSNLLEALRWVMGENRPTAMRGGGMEDVIFAGTTQRSARSFAEVQLLIDNADRLAPAGFNEADQLDVVRRITRDAGSAYKVNGRDVRARDVQMLFADAATGSQSPALVRQGQISELINAKPKARRRILEDAAGIGGLYQRRHEAELKLRNTEANLTRVDDVVEGLAGQLATLTRQARQAARYRAIAAELRQAEGLLLYRRWAEAEAQARSAEEARRAAAAGAVQAETDARRAAASRAEREAALPALREEETIAAAVLQRLLAERDRLADEERRAEESIATLRRRIEQLSRDLEREAALDRDAGETLAGLEAERAGLEAEGAGHAERLEEAAETAREAASILEEREAALAERTEDVARLAARHQSAERAAAEARRMLERGSAAERAARDAAAQAMAALSDSRAAQEEATEREAAAREMAEAAEAALAEAEEQRAEAQALEAEARAERAEEEGAAATLAAELAALSRLLERDSGEGSQILDALSVAPGYEKALGAALAEDLRAPEIDDSGGSGWITLPPYDAPPALPGGVPALAAQVTAPAALARRLAQVGLVEPAAAPALQAALRPGQRLVSRDGDLWRWDGFRAASADMPSAAALRLEQMNRRAAL
ncbi:AAA family ATPase, partial [Roseivivax sp. CAU 1761]